MMTNYYFKKGRGFQVPNYKKVRGLQAQQIFHGEQLQQPAWKAVHIGLPVLVTAYILGTIVTRMCTVMHVRKQQPGRLYLGLSICATNLKQQGPEVLNSAVVGNPYGQPQAGRCECRGKAFQAIISLLFPTEGYAALAPGYLHRQADVYCLPGKSQLFPIFIGRAVNTMM